jgi:uncharacterized membrane protein
MHAAALLAFADGGQALDVVELAARWVHVAAAALWVGLGWWDAWVLAAAPGSGSARLDRALGVWLRWGALVAVGLGVVLLFLVYYGDRTAYLTGALPEAGEWMTALIVGVLGVGVYDVGARALARADLAAQGLAAALVLVFAWFCERRLGFSARGAYVHAGALLGAFMASNVWTQIAPSNGGPRSAQRVRHNAWFALPVLALMLGVGQAGLFGYGVLPTLAVLLALAWVAERGMSAAARG